VLEVGCGAGGDIAGLVMRGLEPQHVTGLDLLETDIEAARRLVPDAQLLVGNGAALPFEDGSFDVTYQVVMLSSVTSPDIRKRIAEEMVRVTRPGGRVVSYDMTLILDRNPHLVALDGPELRRLFGERIASIHRMTLFLPIASRVPSWVRRWLRAVPMLRTHLFAIVEVSR